MHVQSETNVDTPRITKDMLLGDVVQQYPETAAVMLEFGLHCVGCFANQFDTVEQGALLHGMDDAELTEMMERVNEVVVKNIETRLHPPIDRGITARQAPEHENTKS